VAKLFVDKVDATKYIIADYFIKSSTTLKEAAWALAIGQSVGNPNVRSHWETEELFLNHSCMIIGNEDELASKSSGAVSVAFPLANLDIARDGISHLLCMVMGGQLDIAIFLKCHLLDLHTPAEFDKHFKGPKYGMSGVRESTGVYDKPLLGGIIKPKTGISADILVEMVKELVEGGVNFIKEDEIMSNPSCCPITERVPKVMEYLQDKQIIYATCINSDPPYLLDRVRQVRDLGGNAVHVNFWSGLGCYKAIRDLDLDMFLFFQKSGDKILTSERHDFHIAWPLVCKLAGLMGVDFIHAGMWGGYSADEESALVEILDILKDKGVVPSLSCGMHPGLVRAVTARFGVDYMANVGGALHGHPGGSRAGAKAMRQAIDGEHGPEYAQAVEKWGLVG
jgi:ribulose-bisphosphate carboxylase large chain